MVENVQSKQSVNLEPHKRNNSRDLDIHRGLKLKFILARLLILI
jgi:hypothetical protein